MKVRSMTDVTGLPCSMSVSAYSLFGFAVLRVEQPCAFGITQRAAQGLNHALHGLVEFRFRHALAREREAKARREPSSLVFRQRDSD